MPMAGPIEMAYKTNRARTGKAIMRTISSKIVLLLWLFASLLSNGGVLGATTVPPHDDRHRQTLLDPQWWIEVLTFFLQLLGGSTPSPITPSPVAPSPVAPSPPEQTFCGCSQCTATALNALAIDATCGDRIDYLLETFGSLYTEQTACIRVANYEYSGECGSCDPLNCDGRAEVLQDAYCNCEGCAYHEYRESLSDDKSCQAKSTWLQLHEGQSVSDSCKNACTDRCNPDTCRPTSLYCFPDTNRVEYNWGDYTVQVKESSSPCGPGDNWFSKDTVQVNNGEVTLQFKYDSATSKWLSSEVRIIPNNNEAYSYGTYRFSVKSVEVKESNNIVVSNSLPRSLVLGLFTWDDTDDFSQNENRNHELDIEFSQWNDPNNVNSQFLVQPPGSPQQKRFNSPVFGEWWEFTWNPNSISWDSSFAETHSYETPANGVNDHVQCLPASVDVRMNLWNMLGLSAPTGMTESQILEVVVESFSYAASGQAYAANDTPCSKDCQCQNSCINWRCT